MPEEYTRITLSNSHITSYYNEQETAEYCHLEIQTIRFLADAGVLGSIDVVSEERRYSDDDLVLLRRARRLSRDLGINLEGIEIILRLHARVEALQREISQYKEAQEGQ